MQVQTSGRRFQDPSVIGGFFKRALDAVRRVPGVSDAGFTTQLPLTGDFDVYGVHFADRTHDDAKRDSGAFRYAVTPGYVESIGIPLVRGRLIDARDTAGSPPVVLLNESFARRHFPSRDPIGQRLRVGPDQGPWATIVGVVGDVRQMSLAADIADAVYLPSVQWFAADSAMWLVVRAHGDPAALAPAIKQAIWSIDKDQPIVRVATMEARLAASAAERRFALVLLEAFALVALALAATGIYGVLSGSVTERTREIGVRSALGASRGNILALIVRQGMTLTAIGIAAGIGGALAASGALSALLFGISRLDPITYIAVIALLATVSAAACALPAWRAARVDPAATLRAG
jgi:putative ABC transport system permease protein